MSNRMKLGKTAAFKKHLLKAKCPCSKILTLFRVNSVFEENHATGLEMFPMLKNFSGFISQQMKFRKVNFSIFFFYRLEGGGEWNL